MSEIAEHLKEVGQWLDENVDSYPTPKTITLSDFSVSWEEMIGSFSLQLDEKIVGERFRFSVGQNGWVQYHLPMFTSPLGAPASYCAVDLTDDTAKSLTKALRSIFPRLKPFGIDAVTGGFIGQRTPVVERIVESREYDSLKLKIEGFGFSIAVNLL